MYVVFSHLEGNIADQTNYKFIILHKRTFFFAMEYSGKVEQIKPNSNSTIILSSSPSPSIYPLSSSQHQHNFHVFNVNNKWTHSIESTRTLMQLNHRYEFHAKHGLGSWWNPIYIVHEFYIQKKEEKCRFFNNNSFPVYCWKQFFRSSSSISFNYNDEHRRRW